MFVSTNDPTSWQWTITPSNYTLLVGSSLTDKNVYLTFTSSNSYSISLKATNAEGSNTVVKNNHINVSTSATQTTNANFEATETQLETGDATTLIDLSSYAPSSWKWTITPMTGVTYQTGSNVSQFPTLKFANVGTYTVKLEATNANGKDTEEKVGYITVGYPLGVKNDFALDFKLYPNPSNGLVAVLGNFDASLSKIDVLNINGQVVKSFTKTNTLDVSELATGTYIVRIIAQNKIGIEKLIKN